MFDSLNVVEVKYDIVDKSTKYNCIKGTTTRYLCLNCKAVCNDVQVWSRHKNIEILKQEVFKSINKEEDDDETK